MNIDDNIDYDLNKNNTENKNIIIQNICAVNFNHNFTQVA